VTKDKLLEAALAEYMLDSDLEDAAERRGRRAAIRGLMVRMKCYPELCNAIEEYKKREWGDA